MKRYPQPGVSIAVFDGNGRVALVKRGKGPYRGLWSLPGGAVERGETSEAAARRELLEETGLKAGGLVAAGHLEPIIRNSKDEVEAHYLLAVFACTNFSGALCAGDDAADAKWISRADFAGLQTTPQLPVAIERAAQSAGAAF